MLTSYAVISTGNYWFESNSQLTFSAPVWSKAVISTGNYWFESNSQRVSPFCYQSYRCDFHWKLLIWKQFTTAETLAKYSCTLWFPLETTDLKAIHNSCCSINIERGAVISTGNYWFESNSQHKLNNEATIHRCDFHWKLLIWKQFTTPTMYSGESSMLWFPLETTDLKAIHNSLPKISNCRAAVISTGNYWFESNSQQILIGRLDRTGCDFHWKLLIWKQFTTRR